MVSVTQILETFPERELVDWQLRVGKVKAEQVSREALRIGKEVDEKIQQDVKTGQYALYPEGVEVEITACLKGWERFKSEHPGFLSTIVRMQQELIQGEIVGHSDFVLKRDGHNGLCELKCAGRIRPLHWTQVAAYSWLKNPEINADFLAILRLDKEKETYEYVELTDPDHIDYEVQIWLDYKQLYEHRQRVADRDRLWREAKNLQEYLP